MGDNLPISSGDVEKAVAKWVGSKYRDVKGLAITKLWKEGDIYSVDVEFEIKTGIFSSERRMHSLQVDASSGEVVGYK